MGRTFFRFVTMHAFDRRTDGQTDGQTNIFSWLIPPCSAVKMVSVRCSLPFVYINPDRLVIFKLSQANWQNMIHSVRNYFYPLLRTEYHLS